MATDEQLLLRVCSGNEDAFETLYERYQGTSMAIAYRVLGDVGAAEDVLQEAFLSVWRQARTYDPARRAAKAWIVTIVRNRAIDRLRVMLGSPVWAELTEAEGLADGQQIDPCERVCRASEAAHVRGALQILLDDQRQILELAYFSGLTQVQIADALAMPLGTVKSRTRLGLQRLKRMLEPHRVVGRETPIPGQPSSRCDRPLEAWHQTSVEH